MMLRNHSRGLALAIGMGMFTAMTAWGQAPAGMPDLVAGLKATQGCLGVETAQTSSGKNVIFAWFEDKKAVMRWYTSEMHQQVMKLGGPLPAGHPAPLAGVAADSGPIMVVASLTPSKEPPSKTNPLPVSQISIELYQPTAGGAYVGGRFAPMSVKVPGMHEEGPSAAAHK